MKKIVLLQLKPYEAEILKSLYANRETYRALLSNKYLSIDEKHQVDLLYKNTKDQLSSEYKKLLLENSIPYIGDTQYKISENNELYVEIY
jgi:hypothetical protein